MQKKTRKIEEEESACHGNDAPSTPYSKRKEQETEKRTLNPQQRQPYDKQMMTYTQAGTSLNKTGRRSTAERIAAKQTRVARMAEPTPQGDEP